MFKVTLWETDQSDGEVSEVDYLHFDTEAEAQAAETALKLMNHEVTYEEQQETVLKVSWPDGKILPLIKRVRQATGMDLKEARGWVGNFWPRGCVNMLRIKHPEHLQALLEELDTLRLSYETDQMTSTGDGDAQVQSPQPQTADDDQDEDLPCCSECGAPVVNTRFGWECINESCPF